MRRAAIFLAILVLVAACSGPQPSAPAQSASPAASAPAATPAAASASSPARPGVFTVEELLKLKRVSDPQLSPDGTHIAFVVTEADQQANSRANHIWMVKTSGGAPVQLFASAKSDDTPRWSPDGKRLAFVSTREAGSQIWIGDVDASGVAGTPRKLTSLATEASGVRWSPDGRWLAFVSDAYPECTTLDCNQKTLAGHEANKVKARTFDALLFRHWVSWKEGRFSHLFLMSADSPQPPYDLTPGRADVPPFSLGGPDDYAFSPDSKEIAYAKKTDAVEATSTNSDLFLIDLTNPQRTARAITPNRAADAGPAYSPDGRYIAYRAQARPGVESDRWQLMLYDRRTGEHRAAAPSFDTWVDSYAWTPDSKAIYLTAEQEGRVVAFRLDLSGTTPRPLAISGSAGDVQVAPDGRTIVFSRSSASEPAEIYRANADGSDASAVTRLNMDAMAAFKLRPAESVSYAGAGGTRIQAWIVKPSDFRDDRKYPLLFLVHGGPQGSWADSWGYRWNPQVFAAAGYVVFMPNPRGSTGFGQRMVDEISGDWGGKVFDDLMKGADYAEALPYVERGRAGAAGASFGGYMMDWFLGHTTRFKAIVTHSGVYNLASMYGVTEELWFPEWDLKGTPWTNPALYDRFSPHRYAKNFKTPTLVTHGELDFRVPIGEGLQLFTTLQRLGVPSKMLYFPDEGHWINKPGNSALWYHTFIEWMDRWVKAD
jgi:dipeptidyl aminopeptidase/acylaminoacyl peptidase